MHRKSVLLFRNDSSFDQMHSKATNYNKFLKEIPVNDLLEATDLEQMATAVKLIFDRLGRVHTFNQIE